MIYILRKESDPSCELIVDRLNQFNLTDIRLINDLTELHDIKFSEKDLMFYKSSFFNKYLKTGNEQVNRVLFEEKEVLICHILYLLKKHNVKQINYADKEAMNKLIQLDLAKKHGFIVPNYTVITNSDSIKAINGKKITKPLMGGISIVEKEKAFSSYTEELPTTIASKKIFPSLVQEKIDKAFEIRTFFLNHKTYSIAIISQLDDQTKVDFRKYNHSRPNRMVPYELPISITEKISSLMNALNLVSGSLDFILNSKGEYVFLEVNPYGEFGVISQVNNIDLEGEYAAFIKTKYNG